jgi:hypothetical protein
MANRHCKSKETFVPELLAGIHGPVDTVNVFLNPHWGATHGGENEK